MPSSTPRKTGPSSFNRSACLAHCVGYFAKPVDCGLFVRPVNPKAVRVTGIISVPMAKDIVITARPTEFRQHIVLGQRRERGEHTCLVAFDEPPVDPRGT